MKLEVYKRTIRTYIASATENSIQWYKTADDDLPEDTSVKRVFVGNNEYHRLYYSCGKWYCADKGGLSFIGNVIAWCCEEPQFMEEIVMLEFGIMKKVKQ